MTNTLLLLIPLAMRRADRSRGDLFERVRRSHWTWKSLLVLVLVIALGLNACAAKTMPSLSDEQRGRFGRLDVVVVEAPAKAEVAGPTPLGGVGGAVTGAAKGLGIGLLSGAVCLWGDLRGCAVLLMTPYWVGRGTIEGAMNATPEGERRENQAAISAAIDDVDKQRIARAIEQERRRRSASERMTSPEPTPPRMSGEAAQRGAASNSFDTVAEITLLRLGLEGRSSSSSESVWKLSVPDVDPLLDLMAEAQLRVVSASDNIVLFERTYVHRGGRVQRFAEWARDAATEFRNARDEALDALARDIAGELFGVERATAVPSEETVSEPPTNDTY